MELFKWVNVQLVVSFVCVLCKSLNGGRRGLKTAGQRVRTSRSKKTDAFCYVWRYCVVEKLKLNLFCRSDILILFFNVK